MKFIYSSVALSLVVLSLQAVSGDAVDHFECKSEGRFADPLDCASYIACTYDSEGESFTATQGSCKSNAFDPVQGACVTPSSVSNCKAREPKNYVPSREFSDVCKENVLFTCGNCKTLIQCVDGVAYEEECLGNMVCSNNSEFSGGVCENSSPSCPCEVFNKVLNDPYSQSAFYQCDDKTKNLELYHCPEKMVFDTNSSVCKNSNGLPPCYKMGIFTKNDNCSIYYSCIQTSKGWVQLPFECDNNTIYDEDSGKCVSQCDFVDKSFECTTQGRFGHPASCNNYFECIQSGDGTFVQVERSCPSNLFWSDERKFCVKEKPSTCDKPKSKCPIDASKCV